MRAQTLSLCSSYFKNVPAPMPAEKLSPRAAYRIGSARLACSESTGEADATETSSPETRICRIDCCIMGSLSSPRGSGEEAVLLRLKTVVLFDKGSPLSVDNSYRSVLFIYRNQLKIVTRPPWPTFQNMQLNHSFARLSEN